MRTKTYASLLELYRTSMEPLQAEFIDTCTDRHLPSEEPRATAAPQLTLVTGVPGTPCR